jgi:hypothetical protein
VPRQSWRRRNNTWEESLSANPFAEILNAPVDPGSQLAAWKAVATLHHALFTGLILLIANRKGDAVVGEWIFRTFRRQHHEKFLSSFAKLGLSDKPDAVACAQYHYLSNSVGGVEVEYMHEADNKAWVRFCHPRWMYEGTALCGAPVSVSHGFLRGWYGHNGVSLGNPRLGFVCTSQDMTCQYGLSGYFMEYDRDLAPDERLQFAPNEIAPPFDPSAAPALPEANWPAERLHKANRNYAMEYVKTSLVELVALLGPAEAAALGGQAARIIGRQYYRELQSLLGREPDDARGFANFLRAMFAAQDDGCEIVEDHGDILVRHDGWRLMRGIDAPHPAAFDAWAGLWEGCLSVHNRFIGSQIIQRRDQGEAYNTWRLKF